MLKLKSKLYASLRHVGILRIMAAQLSTVLGRHVTMQEVTAAAIEMYANRYAPAEAARLYLDKPLLGRCDEFGLIEP